MAEALPDRSLPAYPRWVAALIAAAIALAALAALLWPSLPLGRVIDASRETGVIRRQIDAPAAAGRIGAVAPDFEWNAADGGTARLSELRGKVVVINFWATWCVPCRQEMPALNRVAASSSDVVFLEVDLEETPDQVRSFVSELGLDHLTPLIDSDGGTNRRYGLFGLPSTFFVDRDGIIRHVELGGPLDEERIKAGIEKAR